MRPNHLLGRKSGGIPAFTAALMAAGVLTNVHAQIQKAGDLFVDVDATSVAAGPVTSLVNRGTLGGVFAATGGPTATPTGDTIGGTKAIRLDGGDYLQHMSAATDGTPITAPAELTGAGPTRSIEVWAWNPTVDGEETMVSWGHRGDPPGGNMSFNYGSDFRWGAVGHWGNPDLGWNNTGGSPTPGKWHHLVYTFDGAATRVYSDGALSNAEYVGPNALNTFPDTTILIGAQTEPDGIAVTGGLRLTGAIGRVRVHDGVLTPAQIANNYNFEKAAFIDPVAPQPEVITAQRLSKAPIHRWNFNNAAGDATDAPVEDTVGDKDGVVLGAGATFTGSRLVLPGGASATAAYVDLPNGLLSGQSANNGGTGKFSIEAWVKITAAQNWGRVFDFGSTVAPDTSGEVFGPGGGGEGRDYFTYTATRGTEANFRRLELRNEDPGGGGVVTVDNPTAINVDSHLVVTWDEETGKLTAYENGRQVSTVTTDDKMSDINDVNVWLGRSNWTGDANAQGEFDEVRIYNHVLTPGEVLGNVSAGPNELNNRDFAPSFAANPANTTAPSGGPATFTAQVFGSSPLTVQWLRNGTPIPNATNTSYTVPSVTLNDNNAVFTVAATSTVNGTPTTVTSAGGTLTVVPPTDRLTAGPTHRWSFNEPAGDAPSETAFNDSVGDMDGVILGDGATFTGTRMVLPGGSSASAAYGDLPNGLLSSHSASAGGTGKFSIEAWVKVTAAQNWGRVFDIGSSTAPDSNGEVFGPGGGGEGRDYFTYTATRGAETGFRRFEFRNEDPAGGGSLTVDNPTATFGQDVHLLVTWDEATGRIITYENGAQVGTAVTDDKMSDVNDVNVWLGRSNWTADANVQGEFDEVRTYNYVVSSRQALGNYVAGSTLINDRDIAPTFIASPQSRAVPEGANIVLTAQAIGSTPMTLQWFRNGVAIAGAINATLPVNNVSAADNNAVFTVVASNSVNGQPANVTSSPATLTVTPYVVSLKHRYGFNETAGTVVKDLVGTADGAVVGTGTFEGGQLNLDGTDGFVDLPNGIISALGLDGTIELWIDNRTAPIWTRIFDFGTSTLGEGESGNGVDYLFLTPRNGDGIPQFTANFPAGPDVVTLVPLPPGNIAGGQQHVVIAWMASRNISRLYIDGVLVASGTASKPLSDLAGADVNNWLGRSQFVADAYWAGSFNEVRLSSGAMNTEQVAASFAAGPNTLPVLDKPKLTITRSGADVVISWPATATGFILESAPSMNTPVVWTPVAGAAVVGANMQVTVTIQPGNRFFRLKK